MRHVIYGLICTLACGALLIAPAPATGQSAPAVPEPGSPEHLLDGIGFNYFYQNGSGIQIAFYNGMVQYEWIAGPRTGNRGEDIPYDSRQLGDDLFLVSWHEPEKPDYLSLVINLENNVIYSSAILRYGTENELVVFQGGIIEHVTRTDR